MSIQSEIDRLADIKAAMKSAINGSGSTVGDKFSDYPPAVTNGRAGIAAAITEKGVQTSADAPFDVLEANVKAIQAGAETVTGKMIMETFIASLTIAWSDGENGHFENVESSHDDITVMKGSVLYLNGFSSISGGVSEVKLTGGTPIGGDRVYLVTGDFTLKY